MAFLHARSIQQRDIPDGTAICPISGDRIIEPSWLVRDWREYYTKEIPFAETLFKGGGFWGRLLRADIADMLVSTQTQRIWDIRSSLDDSQVCKAIRSNVQQWRAEKFRSLVNAIPDEAISYSQAEMVKVKGAVTYAWENLHEIIRLEEIPDSGDSLLDFLWSGLRPMDEIIKLMGREVAGRFPGERVEPGLLNPEEVVTYVNDHLRTKRWIQTLDAALDQVLNNNPLEPIHVVDAGCGPIPIFAIWAALRDPKVRVTALELHPTSAVVARIVVKKFDLENQITILEQDARHWPADPIHVLISETVDTGMTGESVHQIIDQLSKYVINAGYVIPEAVAVKAKIVPRTEITNPSKFFFYQKKFCASTTSPYAEIANWSAANKTKAHSTIELDIPAELNNSNHIICLSCHITLGTIAGRKFELKAEESYLTRALPVALDEEHSGTAQRLHYDLGRLKSTKRFSSL